LNNAESEGKFNKLPSIGVPERVKNAYKKLETLKQAPDLIRFYIKQKFRDDIPWNSKLESYQTGDDQHHKIEKYLKGSEQRDQRGDKHRAAVQ
jgi:hypothetical protein